MTGPDPLSMYATRDELKAHLDIASDDDAINNVLDRALTAASRQIDGWCDRWFTSEPGTLQLTAETPRLLVLPVDLGAITSLSTDGDGDRVYETAWSAGEYDLGPVTGPPYVLIRPVGGAFFPLHRRAVEVAATWGYGDEIPKPIIEATLLQASRLFKRKDAPFGVAGSIEHGQIQTITRIDPDVTQLIAPYRRIGVGVI